MLAFGYKEHTFEEWFSKCDRVCAVIPWTCEEEEITKHKDTEYDYLSFCWHLVILLIFNKWYGSEDGDKADKVLFCSELSAIIHKVPRWWRTLPRHLAQMAGIGLTKKDINTSGLS